MKAYPVTVLCRVMQVSRSGFYDYLRRFHHNDGGNDQKGSLKAHIRAIFQESKGSYGSRRILKKLQSDISTAGAPAK
jgi:putative transposase